MKMNRKQAWSEKHGPRKRLHGRIQGSDLEELTAQRPQAYATAVVAAQRAVAEESGCSEVAEDRLEMSPLRWNIALDECLLVLWRARAAGAVRWQAKMRAVSLRSLLKEL